MITCINKWFLHDDLLHLQIKILQWFLSWIGKKSIHRDFLKYLDGFHGYKYDIKGNVSAPKWWVQWVIL